MFFSRNGVLLGFAKLIDKVAGKDDVVIQFGKSILVFDKKSPINYKGISEVLNNSSVESTIDLNKLNISKKARDTISPTISHYSHPKHTVFIVGLIILFIWFITPVGMDLHEKNKIRKKYKTLRCIDEIINGKYSKNSLEAKNLLKSKNKDIIKAIYENIEKIAMTEEDLLKFLKKNKLEINERIYQCFT